MNHPRPSDTEERQVKRLPLLLELRADSAIYNGQKGVERQGIMIGQRCDRLGCAMDDMIRLGASHGEREVDALMDFVSIFSGKASIGCFSKTPKMAQVVVLFSAGMNGLVRILFDYSFATNDS